MHYLKIILVGIFIFPVLLGAQNLLMTGDGEANFDKLENWGKTSAQIAIDSSPYSGKSCFKMTSQWGSACGSEFIPVYPDKKYKISGWFKRSVDGGKMSLYLGLISFDLNKVLIASKYVNTVAASETELAVPCKAGDIVIQVKDASKWKIKTKYNFIAFATDNSGTYRDLPNSNITPVISAEKQDNSWKITLSEPCGKAYPENTPVRLHHDGSNYTMSAVAPSFTAYDWEKYSTEINAIAKSGTPGNQFCPGTKYVKVAILATGRGITYFDNFSFEEVK
ncbi:MAG: hypothetical protein UT30_C0004G0004 [Candidatus Uhrbacteria bacterium GW2011_GWF2_39_13]|uniref:Uncharacterized protein n=1 Tax=Candidatus Uhrbacteria bacterium GW2011_GWF2_39_13 TaxID=1618995 RepID=A0A0G0MW99_9BACT|nr:MAG: hypothetical protein UT30_C0004G0004 [Candidatus Uhrbacteria bacterium GW2011_GWF2_39_13]